MKRLFSFILSLGLCTVALASATNRKVVKVTSTTVEQVTHYYPYGGVIGDISTQEGRQKYKFEGKELDRSFGLDNYDIHARNYYAMLPMWDRVDPLAQKYYGISPYVYCAGNPVNRGDYDGRDILDIAAGFIIGFGTDIIPGTGYLRDSYSPTDADDYNNGLQVADNAAFLTGSLLSVIGNFATAITIV